MIAVSQTRLLALAVGATALLAATAAYGAPLSISAERAKATAGAEVAVPIVVRGASGMEGLQFVLTFDPKVLESIAVDLAPLAGAGRVDLKVREPGRIRVAMYPEATLAKDGVLLVARFTAVGEVGAETTIDLADARAWEVREAFPVEMLVTAEPGSITVARSPAVPPWIWLAITGVLVVFVARHLRRRVVQQP